MIIGDRLRAIREAATRFLRPIRSRRWRAEERDRKLLLSMAQKMASRLNGQESPTA